MKKRLRTRLSYPLFMLLLTLLLVQSASTQELKPADMGELVPGPSVERELAGGNSHSYRVRLTAKQYLKVVVNQKGIDVVVLVVDPQGQKLTEVDYTGGSETVFVVAEGAGEYRVEVRTSDKEAKKGTYEIGIAELREANDKDRVAVAAEKLLEDGDQLRNQRTTESRRNAVKKYEEALRLWRDAGDTRGVALTLDTLGVVHSNLGEFKKAVEFYSQALVLMNSAEDRISKATTLTNMGTAYWRMGESQKALESHGQALPLAKAAGDSQIEGLILSNTGAVLWSMGQPQDALTHFNQSLVISQRLGDRRQQAITLNNIAACYQVTGDLQNALESINEVIRLRQAMGDTQGTAGPLNNLGLLNIQLGDLQKALEYYNQALELRRADGDRPAQATNLQGLSIAYLRLGDLEAARKHADEALKLAQAVADPRLQAYVLDVFGMIHQLSGEHKKALDVFEQSLSLRRKVGDRYGETFSLTNIGNTYFELGDPGKTLNYYRQSLELSRAIGNTLGYASTLYGIARAHSKMGDRVSARAEIEEALAIIESTRVKVPSQDFRSSFLASYQDYFQFYINLLMQLHQDQPAAGNDVQAFAASERGRARGLLELLTEAKVDVRQGIAPDLKQREDYLQARISWIQSQLLQAHLQSKPDQNRIALLNEEFKTREDERARLAIEIRQNHPRYANLRYPSPLGVKDIQQSLDEKTVLVEYSLGKDASYLFAISKHDFLTARLPAASLLTNQVMALRETVAGRPDRMGLSNYLQKARALFEDLVLPANRLLRGKQSLIIVPDGVLHYLPFEALLQSDSGRRAPQLDLQQLPYLIRDFSISYAPSATVLVNLRSVNPATAPRKAFLAFGDPLYGRAEPDQRAPIRRAFRSAFGEGKPWELQPLPESRYEVERIATLYSRQRVGVFLGRRASEENVKAGDSLGQYRFVHFAVHGLLNENKPQYSGLVLSLPRDVPDPKGKANGLAVAGSSGSPALAPATKTATTEDGLLQVYEIFNLKLNSDLVVLSACESGLGKETRGEGLVGLTQAFFYAGTPSLMVSLWKVQDKSTAALMVRFYRHLNNPALGKAQALRQAQLEMIRSGDYSHPYYWAGFVLTGKP